MLSLRETINRLKASEESSRREGYHGDARNRAFQRHVLELLSKIVQHKKQPSSWNLFVGKYLRQGKTIKEASLAWNKRKPKA